jgi:hypothetical protein
MHLQTKANQYAMLDKGSVVSKPPTTLPRHRLYDEY